MEDNTVDQQTVNAGEMETLNQDAQTDEGQQADVVKQEESPYKSQLEELLEREKELKNQLDKKEEIIEHKNRALEATKKKLKEAPEVDLETLKSELADQLKQEIRAELSAKDLERKISSLTSDKVEQEVIKKHYMSSIVRTGDLDVDLRRAVAVANDQLVWEQKSQQAMQEQRENYLVNFQSSSIKSNNAPQGYPADPVKREAAKFLESIGRSDAIKNLK